jgi:hypothetical protein
VSNAQVILGSRVDKTRVATHQTLLLLLLRLLRRRLLLLLCPQVILGSSVGEALSWAQQEGSLPPAQAQLISAALAAKGEPFNSERET